MNYGVNTSVALIDNNTKIWQVGGGRIRNDMFFASPSNTIQQNKINLGYMSLSTLIIDLRYLKL